MSDFVPVRREDALLAAQELEETAEYVDIEEQEDRFTRLLEAAESIRMSANGDHDGKHAHPTRDACVADEKFIDEPIDEYHGGQAFNSVVRCPDCGRRFEYVYDYEGIFNTEAKAYIERDEFDTDWEWDSDAAYYDGQTYNVPEENGTFERVYILQGLWDPVEEAYVWRS